MRGGWGNRGAHVHGTPPGGTTVGGVANRLVIVDADLLAGWRRATPSLVQLREAVGALAAQEPGVAIAVVADPALKWRLEPAEQADIENDIVSRFLVMAPAGSAGGHVGFIARVVEVAAERGFDPVVITARSVPGARLGRPRRVEGAWNFDLDAEQPTIVATGSPVRRRRRRPTNGENGEAA